LWYLFKIVTSCFIAIVVSSDFRIATKIIHKNPYAPKMLVFLKGKGLNKKWCEETHNLFNTDFHKV